MQYIGKLDKNKLGKYKDKIITNKFIITNERIEHIQKRHEGDYENYIKYIPNILKIPDYILEDINNQDTIRKNICGGKILCRPHADGKQGKPERCKLWHAYHIFKR